MRLPLYVFIALALGWFLSEIRHYREEVRGKFGTDLHTSIRKKPMARDRNSPSIVFVINSAPEYYNTRIKEVRETWGKIVLESDRMKIIIVTTHGIDQTEIHNEDSVIVSDCPEAYAGIPECCKRGHMYQIAFDYLNSNEGSFTDWVAFIDDDNYILPYKLLSYISNLGPAASHEFNLYGGYMGSTHCTGFWGGTGYLTNRKTLDLIVNGGAGEDIRVEAARWCKHCDEWGDITLTWIPLHRRGGLIQGSDVLHSESRAVMYNTTREELAQVYLNPSKPIEVWNFHHSSRGNMYWIHDRVMLLTTPPFVDNEFKIVMQSIFY